MTVQNLIINGGFETGTLSPWAGINATISMQYSHSDFFSARLQGGNTVSYIAQIVSINPGEGFEFLVSLAKVGLAPAAPVIIQVIYLDNLSISTGNGFFTNIPVDRIPTANSDTWLEIYQTTIPAPPNTTQAVIVINTLPQLGTADILVDDVALLSPLPETSGLNEFQVGTNTSPFSNLIDTTPITLSTVTITTDNPGDTVKLTASINSETQLSVVSSPPFQGNVVEYSIRRITPSQNIETVQDTDFDELTTTFIALDNPGVGTFTYVLEGSLLRSTPPEQFERIKGVVFVAEEIGPNTP